MRRPVELVARTRRGRSRRCTLYSVGPSCGSGASLSMLRSMSRVADGAERPPSNCGCSVRASLSGTDLSERSGAEGPFPGQGEDIRGGSGSNVKMDAMAVST